MQILVCGGASHIGSHMYQAIASTGHRWAVICGSLIKADLLDSNILTPVSDTPPIAAVVHEANGSRLR
jgi:UDP-glucose 4-epimerase